MARRLAALIVLLLFAASLGACFPAPKYIAASTGRPGNIKFLYTQRGNKQGVIKCDRAEDGTLSNCRKIKIVLEGEDPQ